MKTLILSIISLLTIQLVISQGGIIRSTMCSIGNSKTINTNGRNIALQQSIGQLSSIGLFKSGAYGLSQGFNRPSVASKALVPTDPNSKSNLDASFYPNPVDKLVNISFKESITDLVLVTVYDLAGRIIYSKGYPPSQKISVNIGDIASGRHFLDIYTMGKHFIAHLIKQ